MRTARTEAEGAPPIHRTRTAVRESATYSTSSAATIATDSNSNNVCTATALVERVGDTCGEESQPTHTRTESHHSCRAKAQRYQMHVSQHVENTWRKSRKSRIHQNRATHTRPPTGRWVDSVRDDEEKKVDEGDVAAIGDRSGPSTRHSHTLTDWRTKSGSNRLQRQIGT